jgi:hypothetical protein
MFGLEKPAQVVADKGHCKDSRSLHLMIVLYLKV